MVKALTVSADAQALAICGAQRAQQQLHRITGAMRLLSGQMSDRRGLPDETEFNSFCDVLFWLTNTAVREAEAIDEFLEKYYAEQAARDVAAGKAEAA